MPPHRKFSKKVQATALKLLKKGEAAKKIAEQLGTSPSTISVWKREAGLAQPRKKKKTTKKVAKKKSK